MKGVVSIKRYWTDEEVTFLKFAYSNEDFSVNDICEALNRSKSSVLTKASILGIKKIHTDTVPEGYKKCSTCKTILPKTPMFYPKASSKPDGFHCMCKECKNKKRKNLKNNCSENIEYKICNKCNKEKPLSEFSKNKKMKDGYLNQCKECRYELDKRAYIRGGY